MSLGIPLILSAISSQVSQESAHVAVHDAAVRMIYNSIARILHNESAPWFGRQKGRGSNWGMKTRMAGYRGIMAVGAVLWLMMDHSKAQQMAVNSGRAGRCFLQ